MFKDAVIPLTSIHTCFGRVIQTLWYGSQSMKHLLLPTLNKDNDTSTCNVSDNRPLRQLTDPTSHPRLPFLRNPPPNDRIFLGPTYQLTRVAIQHRTRQRANYNLDQRTKVIVNQHASSNYPLRPLYTLNHTRGPLLPRIQLNQRIKINPIVNRVSESTLGNTQRT
jgi:hypothetical protein